MTAVLETARPAEVPLASRTCCACRAVLEPSGAEPVPGRPGLVRCRDEDACRERFRPRRLARSVRKDARAAGGERRRG